MEISINCFYSVTVIYIIPDCAFLLCIKSLKKILQNTLHFNAKIHAKDLTEIIKIFLCLASNNDGESCPNVLTETRSFK